jgi:hypothetical protein
LSTLGVIEPSLYATTLYRLGDKVTAQFEKEVTERMLQEERGTYVCMYVYIT